MLRSCLSFLLLLFPCFLFFGSRCSADVPDRRDVASAMETAACAQLYRIIQLEDVVGWDALRQAIMGYHKIASRKQDMLILIDLSRSPTEKCLFVLDTKQHRLLLPSVVSRGENGGGVYATSFSNEYGSCKSSLGFYLTETTYQGKNGYSLILNGLERGINDYARERATVIHGAAYADLPVVDRGERLGYSFSCPAVPQKLARPIIDAIKGGSVMYIYTETPDYLTHSSVLSGYRA